MNSFRFSNMVPYKKTVTARGIRSVNFRKGSVYTMYSNVFLEVIIKAVKLLSV